MFVDMSENIDVWVCQPDVAITQSLRGIAIQFEEADRATFEGIGRSHTVALTTDDAMLLLVMLEHIQKQHDLQKPDVTPVEVRPPLKGKH